MMFNLKLALLLVALCATMCIAQDTVEGFEERVPIATENLEFDPVLGRAMDNLESAIENVCGDI